MAQEPTSNWWMYHADPAHSGTVTGSSITSANASQLQTFKDIPLDGPILSKPAIGNIAATFRWDIAPEERDTHGFCGMGCTPAVADGKVYFVAFNGKLYCLDQGTLEAVWITDLRCADPLHNQPVTNTLGMDQGAPPVAGWSSPLVVNGRVYTGIGEGENPFAYSFVYCLDGATGNVIWLFCTNQFTAGGTNQPNQVPAAVVDGTPPPPFTVVNSTPVTLGCSVWGGIAYDAALVQRPAGARRRERRFPRIPSVS